MFIYIYIIKDNMKNKKLLVVLTVLFILVAGWYVATQTNLLIGNTNQNTLHNKAEDGSNTIEDENTNIGIEDTVLGASEGVSQVNENQSIWVSWNINDLLQ